MLPPFCTQAATLIWRSNGLNKVNKKTLPKSVSITVTHFFLLSKPMRYTARYTAANAINNVGGFINFILPLPYKTAGGALFKTRSGF